MKITLFAVGTIVDVNLFLALALGLRNLGHRIVLVVPDRHKDYANQYETVVRSWKNPLHNEMIAICRDGDAMIIHPTLAFEAAVVSEKLRMPFMFAASVPYFPGVASFSSPRVSPVGLLSRLPDRWLAYRFNKRKTREMNDWRVRLGMQPFRSSCLKQLERQRFPVLHAYSPTLLPLPRESGEHHFISGVIGLPRSRHLAPVGLQPKLRDELMAWLDSGSPPVYFGASSLPPHMTAK
ncbi:MAG: UDP-glucose--sterol glucosyltransferase, partial [Paenibacillus sp.]|nr:UDP-glucose--sterol glucosyltransferase [Paenibacillus sp.]